MSAKLLGSSFPQQILTEVSRKRLERLREIANQTQWTITQDMNQLLIPRYTDLIDRAFDPRDAVKQGRAQDEMKSMIMSSERRLQELWERAERAFGPDCNRPSNADSAIVRGQRTCRLLKFSVAKAHELNSLATPEGLVTHISKYMQSRGTDTDFLAMRMVLFYSYSPEEQDAIVRSGNVKFVRYAVEVPGKKDFYELHDGYVFGGARLGKNSGNGHDCSDFSSLILRQGMDSPSTGVMKDIYRYLRHEPGVTLKTLGTWARYASCYEAVDLRSGKDQPRPLDLAVVNTTHPARGHVVVVESFDPQTGEVTDFEAGGAGLGSVQELVRPLYEPVCKSPVLPPPRSDVFVLRYREHNNADCPLNLENP